jgi:hypothetical protein
MVRFDNALIHNNQLGRKHSVDFGFQRTERPDLAPCGSLLFEAMTENFS